jgi:hypothetical protein
MHLVRERHSTILVRMVLGFDIYTVIFLQLELYIFLRIRKLFAGQTWAAPPTLLEYALLVCLLGEALYLLLYLLLQGPWNV